MGLKHILELTSASRSSASVDSLYYRYAESGSVFWGGIAHSSDYSQWVYSIRAEGERLLPLPCPELTIELFSMYERTGSRLEYERVYFERRRRLNTFMLLSLLEPDEEMYANKLLEMIQIILSEASWCLPAHLKGADIGKTIDLFSAETGFALSEMASVLGDRLPSALVVAIDAAVMERLIRPFLEHGPHHWETARHNWSSVCAGSIGSAALLRIRDTEVLVKVLSKVLASLNYYLEGYGEDGACPEGIGYWNYGFGYFVYFADLLKKLTFGELDLFRQPKVRSIAMFQQAAYLHGDSVACFSDSMPRVPFRVGLTHYLAKEFPELQVPSIQYCEVFADDHCSRWAPAFRDLVWLEPTLLGNEWGAAARYLPDAQWLVARHATSSGRLFGFAAKGGNNDEPHNHNDIGQFIIMSDGVSVTGDLGAGEYTADYFGEGRYGYDCNGSQGHSVPIVDDGFQVAGIESAAVVLEAVVSEAEDLLRIEMCSAYRSKGLKSLIRELRWSKTGTASASGLPRLTLKDDFCFNGEPLSIVERIVVLGTPLLEAAGVIRLRGKDDVESGAMLRYDEAQLEARIEQRHFRDHFGQNQVWYLIDLKLRKIELTNRIILRFEWQ